MIAECIEDFEVTYEQTKRGYMVCEKGTLWDVFSLPTGGYKMYGLRKRVSSPSIARKILNQREEMWMRPNAFKRYFKVIKEA